MVRAVIAATSTAAGFEVGLYLHGGYSSSKGLMGRRSWDLAMVRAVITATATAAGFEVGLYFHGGYSSIKGLLGSKSGDLAMVRAVITATATAAGFEVGLYFHHVFLMLGWKVPDARLAALMKTRVSYAGEQLGAGSIPGHSEKFFRYPLGTPSFGPAH